MIIMRSVFDQLSTYTNYRHLIVPIISSFTYTKIYRNTRKSYMCSTHVLPAPWIAAFALTLVGYIIQQSLIVLSVSHIFAIFPVNCHGAQEEKAKINVSPSSCTSREDWIKWAETMDGWENDCGYEARKGGGGGEAANKQQNCMVSQEPHSKTMWWKKWCMGLILDPSHVHNQLKRTNFHVSLRRLQQLGTEEKRSRWNFWRRWGLRTKCSTI